MDYKQPNLLATVFLFILGVGIIYFIDIPLYNNNKTQLEQIAKLSEQKKEQEDHTRAIAEIGLAIERNNWAEQKKKMDPNFTSSPFYIPKTEKFFRDLISRSGMTVGTLNIQLGAVNQSAVPTKTTDTKIKPTEQPTAVKAIPNNQSGVVGINGPVKRNIFNISATGTYNELKSLLNIFEKQAYLISVKKISFGEGTNNQFTFNITGEVYSY